MSAEAVQVQAKTTWIERALTDGWAIGWARSPLLWAPRTVTWPARRILTLALLVLGPVLLLMTAAAVVSVLPILFIFVILQKWVVQAAVMTGLKG